LVDKDTAALGSAADVDLEVRVARELIDKARSEGVSLVGPNGLLRQLTKTVLEAALNAELDDHLGYEKGDTFGKFGSNERNGTSPKTVRTDVGEVRIDVPRDREGTFAPQIVPPGGSRVSTTRSSRCMARG
jgi:transposase-like protein